MPFPGRKIEALILFFDKGQFRSLVYDSSSLCTISVQSRFHLSRILEDLSNPAIARLLTFDQSGSNSWFLKDVHETKSWNNPDFRPTLGWTSISISCSSR